MYDLYKAKEIYKKHIDEDANFDHVLVSKWKEKMPEEFARVMYEYEYGCHIFNEEMYHNAVQYLESPTGEKGPHWSLEKIKSKAAQYVDDEAYTLYDYAYVVNMLYSDYCKIITETSQYLQMAKAYLTDKDYFGDASERAYHNAMKRIKYNSQK